MTAAPVLLILDGDSISHGVADALSLDLSGVDVRNVSVWGDTLLTRADAFQKTVVSLAPVATALRVVQLAAGTNDLRLSDDPIEAGAAMQRGLLSYCTAARAAGFKVVLVTVLPRVDLTGPREQARLDYNSAVRALWPHIAHGIADWAADPLMGASTSPTDPVHSTDGVLPTRKGFTRLAEISAAALETVRVEYQSGLPEMTAGAISARRVEEVPPVGLSLAQRVDAGAVELFRTLAEEIDCVRTPPLCIAEIDRAVSQFGHLFGDAEFRRYRSAAMRVYRIGPASLIGSDAVLLQAGTVVPDSLQHLATWLPESAIAGFETQRSVVLRSPLVAQRLVHGPCLVGFTAAWHNFAHWLQQSLPILIAYVRLRSEVPGLRIVLPPFMPGSFQQQTIAMLSIGPDEVIDIGHHEHLMLVDAFVTSTADIWSIPPLVSEAGRALAACVSPLVAGIGDGQKRIYLHRRTEARKLVNFDELQPVLQRYGFQVMSFEDVPLDVQIATVREAEFFVGEHGAGLANMMFCRPGARILELFNPACAQPAFWSLACSANLEFGFIVGQHVSTAERPEPDWNAAYAVSVEQLEGALRLLTTSYESSRTSLPFQRAPGGAPVVFTSENGFNIGTLKFALGQGATSAFQDHIPLSKDAGLLKDFIALLPKFGARRAFELGISDGGSAMFLTSFLGLEKYVGVDLSDPPEAFTERLKSCPEGARIRAYFNTSQTDGASLQAILEQEFGDDGPDLILDDASHHYDLTKRSFEITFPYLAAGGHYVIEAWSWAHWPENQTANGIWSAMPAMSNFIMELLLLLPSSDMIEQIEIRHGAVFVKKRGPTQRKPMLNIEMSLRLRGNNLSLI